VGCHRQLGDRPVPHHVGDPGVRVLDVIPASDGGDDRLPGQLTDAGPPADEAVLDRSLLLAPTLEAARTLLGSLLIRDPAPGGGADRRVGRIVEVEAYIGLEDRASHARMGPTPRNRVMFGPPGHAYVYLVYGMHTCLNIVTEAAPTPAAVLIRAVEPLDGLEAMREARGLGAPGSRTVPDHRLAAGPGLVGAAFGIDRSLDGIDTCRPGSLLRLLARPDGTPAPAIASGPRVGIGYAGEPWISVPWRLWVADSPSLSRGAR
jgi:DNA-3-methyladenine glycosylase